MLRIALVVAAGCGSSNQDGPDTPDAAPPGSTRTIRVSRMFRHHTATGIVDNVFGNPIRTVLERDASGAFRSLDFDPTGDGDVTITAGDGLVYLGLMQGGFIVDPKDDFDGDIHELGRGVSTQGPGQLITGGDGLSPWQLGDDIEIHCPNVFFGPRSLDTAQLTSDATMFGPTALSDVPISAPDGDEIWALQRRDDEVDEVRYSRIVSALHKTDLGPGPGGDARGTFREPVTTQLDLDLRITQFAAASGVALAQLNPRGSIDVLPYGLPDVSSVILPSVTHLDLSRLTADRTISMPFGNPFPASWPVYVRLATDTATREYAVPGGRPLRLGGSLSIDVPLSDAAAAPIVPLIGPVRDLRIDGQPITAATRAQDSPTLSWTPPAMGTAVGYQSAIFLLRLDDSGGTTLSDVVELTTVEPRVQVPPGLLTSGGSYFVVVRALAGAVDVRGAPGRASGAHGQSVVLSETFTR